MVNLYGKCLGKYTILIESLGYPFVRFLKKMYGFQLPASPWTLPSLRKPFKQTISGVLATHNNRSASKRFDQPFGAQFFHRFSQKNIAVWWDIYPDSQCMAYLPTFPVVFWVNAGKYTIHWAFRVWTVWICSLQSVFLLEDLIQGNWRFFQGQSGPQFGDVEFQNVNPRNICFFCEWKPFTVPKHPIFF